MDVEYSTDPCPGCYQQYRYKHFSVIRDVEFSRGSHWQNCAPSGRARLSHLDVLHLVWAVPGGEILGFVLRNRIKMQVRKCGKPVKREGLRPFLTFKMA